MAMMGAAGMGSGERKEEQLKTESHRERIEYNIEYGIDIYIDQTWIRWETIVYIQYIHALCIHNIYASEMCIYIY